MENKIHQILEKIYLELGDVELHASLIGGQAGVALFNILYLKHFKMSEFDVAISQSVQKLAEDSISNAGFSLSSGRTGINWFFSYLNKLNIIDESDCVAVSIADSDLMAKALEFLDFDCYDFLHGGTGIAYYLLYKEPQQYEDFFRIFFQKLNLIKNKNNAMFLHYDTMKHALVPGVVNLGLSHGITSILKFCIECIKRKVCVFEAKSMAQQIIDYLCQHTNSQGSISTFQDMIGEGNSDTWSRLAWCYGDLGIGYILFQAGTVLDNEDLKQFAIDILKQSTKREHNVETGIHDCCICHGSIGVAHIYNTLWNQTREPIFKLATDNWIRKSIALTPYEEDKYNYMYFNNLKKVYEENHGLLEGSAGLGLALISYLTGDFSWNYCLMLN